MDQVYVVRHKVLVEGRSQRHVAKELGIARETVRKYLTESRPIRKETQPRARPVWEAVRARVEQVLAESSQWTGGKQQLTATRLHERLVGEGHRVGVTLVKEAVAEWRRQRREVFVYFDNDQKAAAPKDAQRLIAVLGDEMKSVRSAA